MRGLDTNIYNINEYINLEIYLLGKTSNDVILIKREFYIVDNLIIKVFIDIDILKLEGIVFDVIKDIIIIILYKNLKISIIFNSQR